MNATKNPAAAVQETFFAPAGRASDEELRASIEFVVKNPILDFLLKSVGGLLALLNEQRQIIGINEGFSQFLGCDNGADVLGLRPGEAVHCLHAWDHPGGCGTSRSCASCGAVKAIVACLVTDEPVDQTCSITVRSGGAIQNLCFDIRVCPLMLDGRRFVMMFLRNATEDRRRVSLERVFFDEISGTIAGVLGRSKLLLSADAEKARILSGDIFNSLLKVAQEIRVQRRLVHGDKKAVQPSLQTLSLAKVIKEVGATFRDHPAAKGKRLKINATNPEFIFKTDIWLLMRVLVGMILNAFEASAEGDDIQLTATGAGNEIIFSVWNRKVISPDAIHRIFEPNFSTKPEPGRGMGTYSMKLLGEESLGGKVDFTSTAEEGTVFRLTLTA